MTVASPARITALRLLSLQRRRGARARDLLRSAHEMDALGRKARSLATRLVLGVNVAAGELDRRIDSFASRPGSIQPRVRDALRLASFEVLYLETPPQVAVSQGVELVRGVQPRAAGMANAVLRRVKACRPEVDAARSRVCRLAQGEECALSTLDLAVASGYPQWLCESVLAELGERDAARMACAALDPAPIYVAQGRAEVDTADLADHLSRLADECEPTSLPASWKLSSGARLARTGLVASCDVAVADLSAQIVCRVAAPAQGRVLEVGQGRATKSLLLARAMDELGATPSIAGCELVGSKVALARARMKTAGLAGTVSCTEFDATRLGEDEPPAELSGSFSSVLVDAPCSGTGTMRRHPEIPWTLEASSLDPANPEGLPALQLSILSAASRRVAPGGSLVYATCSVLACENEDVVDAFLASDAGSAFELASVTGSPGIASLEPGALSWVTSRGMYRSIPCAGGPDGHFCARLVHR